MRTSIILAAMTLIGCGPDLRNSAESAPALIALSAVAAFIFIAQQTLNSRPFGFFSAVAVTIALVIGSSFFVDREKDRHIDKILTEIEHALLAVLFFLYVNAPIIIAIIVFQSIIAYPFSFCLLLCVLPLTVLITWHCERHSHPRESASYEGNYEGTGKRVDEDNQSYLNEMLISRLFGFAVGALVSVVIFWPEIAIYAILLSASYAFVMPILSAAISTPGLPARVGMYIAALILMIEQLLLGLLLLDAVEKIK